MPEVSVIVSTYNQPDFLQRCLLALERQTHSSFEVIVADDGSTGQTRLLLEGLSRSASRTLRHLWHEDRGFRKTEILNKAVLASAADYLVFIDGDCIAHPDFVREHARKAQRGHYLNGSLIRLGRQLSERITQDAIVSARAFEAGWLTRRGRRFDRRYLRLALPYGLRCWLNEASRTRLYWLGSNSSCFREDLVAVNGFDNRFSYGFEDGDFGNRLELRGVSPGTVRWTANVLHLWHARPWSDPAVEAANRQLMIENRILGRSRALQGLEEISSR